MPTDHLVLVPLRSFAGAKTRLASVLDESERTALAERLADGVLAALRAWHVAVVTDDDEVAAWTAARDVDVIRPGVVGLNPSVTAAVAVAARQGIPQVAIVHADLARPDGLGELLATATSPAHRSVVTAVPDRHGDGTNVLVVPTAVDFRFQYGPGSFARHRAESEHLGLRFDGTPHADLGWDVDTPDDVEGAPVQT